MNFKNCKINNKIKKIFIIIYNFALLIIIFLLIITNIYIFNNIKPIKSVNAIDNNIIINLNKDNLYCILSDTIPTLDDKNWIESKYKKCNLEYTSNNLYIKNKKEIIYSNEKLQYLTINEKDKIYLSINDTYDYIDILVGNFNDLDITYDNEIISVDSNGLITALKNGTTTLSIKFFNKIYNLEVVSTNLITDIPKTYDFKKDYLSCNEYNKEENTLLDEILLERIKEAGYKTRAGVVEAARFLTLEFPYRINYFYENGRQTTNNVDGEGRYYHVGLYLNSSKFSSITGTSTGKKIWGCSLYSNPAKRYIDNGLDCSGFVSWAILNGGFNIKDIGAGFRIGNSNDLTDYGDLKKLSDN